MRDILKHSAKSALLRVLAQKPQRFHLEDISTNALLIFFLGQRENMGRIMAAASAAAPRAWAAAEAF